MTSFVLDASVAAVWFFRDEADDYADRVLDRLAHEGASVPPLFVWEMANVMLVADRAKRMTAAAAQDALASVFALPIEVSDDDLRATVPALLLLARSHRLSAYDAAYLELALRRGLPLASRDAALAKAARACGIKDAYGRA